MNFNVMQDKHQLRNIVKNFYETRPLSNYMMMKLFSLPPLPIFLPLSPLSLYLSLPPSLSLSLSPSLSLTLPHSPPSLPIFLSPPLSICLPSCLIPFSFLLYLPLCPLSSLPLPSFSLSFPSLSSVSYPLYHPSLLYLPPGSPRPSFSISLPLQFSLCFSLRLSLSGSLPPSFYPLPPNPSLPPSLSPPSLHLSAPLSVSLWIVQ